MIPPSHLPPADSLDGLAVATPPDSDPTNLICSATCGGVRCAPHCAQRFATVRCYVTALITLFLLLGVIRGYLAGLAYMIGDIYGLPDIAIDILLVSAETMQGISSLFVAHGGRGGHRPSWMGAPAFLHAGACFAVLVPFVSHSKAHWLPPARNGTNEYMCEVVATIAAPAEVEPCWTTLVVMIIVQITAGITWAALLTHGLAYLDDNVDSTDSPILLGALLGADRLGPPFGQILAFVCASKSGDVTGGGEISKIWWLGWPILGALLIFAAVLMSMFPKRLPSAAVRERANFILEAVCRRVRIDEEPQDIDMPMGLMATMKRIMRNKIVGLITLFLMFLYAPLHFFSKYENRYLESVYFIPEPEYSGGVFKDEWTSRVTTGFLRPPIVLMTMLLSGMIIARKRPRPSTLAMWNVVVAFIAAIIFFVFIALRCPVSIYGLTDGKLEIEARCNSDCSCPSNIPFLPICERSGEYTYYSPCHAGCTEVEYIDDIKLYNDCKCLKYSKKAKGGACSQSKCNAKWVVFQALGVIVSGLVGTCVVGSVLLCLRTVALQDKMHALAFVIMHIGATHMPGRFLFKFVTEATCIYWGGDYNCQLFDAAALAIWFNVLCGCLLLFAVLFGYLAWRHSKNVKLFKDNLDEPDTMEMNEIRQKLNARLATPFTRRRKKNRHGNSSSDGEESENPEQGNRGNDEQDRGEEAVTQPLQQRTGNNLVQRSENYEQRNGVNEQGQDEELETEPLQQRTENHEVQQSENNRQNRNENRRVWSVTHV